MCGAPRSLRRLSSLGLGSGRPRPAPDAVLGLSGAADSRAFGAWEGPMKTRAPIAPLPAFASAALLLVLFIAASDPAAARECDGVSFPEQVQAHGTTLTLNGL